jgi:predicted dehydrogenase
MTKRSQIASDANESPADAGSQAAPTHTEMSCSRRGFLQAAAAGTGLALAPAVWGQEPSPSTEEIRLAIIGPGSQGRNLLTKCLKIPNVRFVAVCDVWPYHQRYAANILKKYNQPATVYEDYREMLASEKDLDAVIVATPDWVHAEQTITCLEAGLHVYCEKEMSNTLEGCRQMVQAARRTGKLLQVGHQRRSNPRYWHALKMINKDKILGTITHVYGQWNRAQRLDLGWPKKEVLSDDALKRFGYETMEQFRNWRWYKKYAGGPMADLGSHQVDVFNWVLGAPPKSVMASGGRDYYTDREWYDNVLAIYEFVSQGHPVRGFYQVINTSSHGGFYETFMGTEGSMVISEDPRKGFVFREVTAKRREWEDEASKIENMGRDAIELKVGETLAPDGKPTAEAQKMLEEVKKPPHQLHLENFFRAIRGGTPLSCPPEVAYETAVAVLRANDAVAANRTIELAESEFKV